MRILVGATGSVACVKLPELVRELKVFEDIVNPTAVILLKVFYGHQYKMLVQAEVKVILTEKARHFVDAQKLGVQVHTDEEEWMWQGRGDPVLHIELRKWADLLIIAPLDANTLAKLACGICDNLLTCVARAWDLSKPLLFCPAMNTMMWTHPLTSQHIVSLRSFGYEEVPPITKRLVCGDEGLGAMAEVKTIVWRVKQKLEAGKDTEEAHTPPPPDV